MVSILAVHQRSAIFPLYEFFTLAEWSRQISVMGTVLLVDLEQRARLGCTPRRVSVSVSASPSLRLAAVPGWVRSRSLAMASSLASAARVTEGSGWAAHTLEERVFLGRP